MRRRHIERRRRRSEQPVHVHVMDTKHVMARLAPMALPATVPCVVCHGDVYGAGEVVWVCAKDHDGDDFIFAVCEPCHDKWGDDWEQPLSDVTHEQLRQWRKSKRRVTVVEAGKPQ